jgi:hypothetical protein
MDKWERCLLPLFVAIVPIALRGEEVAAAEEGECAMSPVALVSVPIASAGDRRGIIRPAGVRPNDFDDRCCCCFRCVVVGASPAEVEVVFDGAVSDEQPSSGLELFELLEWFEFDRRIGVMALKPLNAEFLTAQWKKNISKPIDQSTTLSEKRHVLDMGG